MFYFRTFYVTINNQLQQRAIQNWLKILCVTSDTGVLHTYHFPVTNVTMEENFQSVRNIISSCLLVRSCSVHEVDFLSLSWNTLSHLAQTLNWVNYHVLWVIKISIIHIFFTVTTKTAFDEGRGTYFIFLYDVWWSQWWFWWICLSVNVEIHIRTAMCLQYS